MKTKASFLLVLTTFLTLSPLLAQPSDYPELKASAEKLYADGSFAQAHDAYEKAKVLELPPVDKRWVDFRLADTLWRSQAATQTADTTQLDNAHKQLDVLNRDISRVEDHDRVWAEVEESLGDYFWTRRNSRDWGVPGRTTKTRSIGGLAPRTSTSPVSVT